MELFRASGGVAPDGAKDPCRASRAARLHASTAAALLAPVK